MKLVYNPEGRRLCYSACLASILELELKDVPDFYSQGKQWLNKSQRWAIDRGYIIKLVYPQDAPIFTKYLFYYIQANHVKTPESTHARIFLRGQCVHDPSLKPGGTELVFGGIHYYVLVEPT